MVKFKAIKQKREFDPEKVKASILAEAKKIGKEMSNDWKKPIATWNGVKPSIGYTVQLSFHILTIFAGVMGGGFGAQKLAWVNDGTRPHLITGNPLAFQANSTPKTMPGTLRPSSGGSSGALVFTNVVHHPGTKARHIDETIINIWDGPFVSRMRAAYLRGLAATGHGM